MKLSDKQREILTRLRDGWTLRTWRTVNPCWTNPEGAYSGPDDARPVSGLRKRNFIEAQHDGGDSQILVLTDKGREAIAQEAAS